MSKIATRPKCLIINYLEMPQPIKDVVAEWCGFGNDCLIPIRSEFDYDLKNYNQKGMEDYHKDQVETNGFKGDLKKFIKDYGLEFDQWFIEQNFNLKGVNRILVEISW